MKKNNTEKTKNHSLFTDLLKNEKVLSLIVICGMIGIGLIFASSYFDKNKTENLNETSQAEDNGFSADNYKQNISQELGNMISSIEGAGKTKIMVTLNGSVRELYAADTDIADKDSAKKTNDNENTDKQNTEKKKYILIRGKDGSEKALSLGQLVPEIKGVLIICEGGDNDVIKEEITDAVSAALNLSKTHICVSKLGT